MTTREIISRPVALKGRRRTAAFCNFMLSTSCDSLFSLLRRLVLVDVDRDWKDNNMLFSRLPTEADTVGLDLLLQMLGRATYLRDLRIHGCDTYFSGSDSDSRFSQAITGLRHLRRLCISPHRNSKHISSLILNLGASLDTLECPTIIGEDASPPPDVFMNSLAQRHPQLDALRITYANPATQTPTPRIPFARLRVLDLKIMYGHLISLQDLVYLFPNVKELAIRMEECERTGIIHLTPEMDTARVAALAFQAAGRGWPRLDVLVGSVHTLYVLAISCFVSKLFLHSYDSPLHSAFVDVLSRTHPRRVTLSLHCPPLTEDCVVNVARNMLVYGEEDDSVRGAAACSHLLVLLRIFVTDVSPAPADDILATLCSILHGSRVEYLHLAIGEFRTLPPPPPSTINDDSNFLAPPVVYPALEATMVAIDVAALVSGLATGATSLRYVVLSVVTRERSVWEIDRSGGQQTARRLDTDTGNAVFAREDLQ